MPGKGRGSTAAQEKSGTPGSDTLDGYGGSYVLSGGRGDDTYFVDDAFDVIDEGSRGGIDTVRASLDWTLGTHLEHLILSGSEDLSATGNSLDNEIAGNDGQNFIIGGGGNDTLDGGAGLDVARFDGSRNDYSVLIGTETVVTNLLTGETDRLSNIELVVFDDATLDITAEAALSVEAISDHSEVKEDTSIVIDLLHNDQGERLILVALSEPAYGAVVDNGDGTVTYSPFADTFGSDQFTYTIRGAAGIESSATVDVEVLSVNDAPVANDDSFEVGATGLLSGLYNVLDNDADADRDDLAVLAAGRQVDLLASSSTSDGLFRFSTSAGGSVELGSDGGFFYEAAAGYIGADSFAYQVTDTSGAVASAMVRLEVTAGAPDEPAPDKTPYYVDALILGDNYRVNTGDPLGTPTVVTFAFADNVPSYYDAASSVRNGFEAFDDVQRASTWAALDELAALTGLSFVETTVEDAQMILGFADLGSSGLAYVPYTDGIGTMASDVWIDDGFAGDSFDAGGTAYKTLIHEIGHALGLVHPELPDGEETRQFSVLAGARHETMGLEEPSGYMLYDIAALQYLYGENDSATSGDDIYHFEDLVGSVRTIWDAGGHDTLDLSQADFGVKIDLREGSFSTVSAAGTDNIGLAFGTEIENATGGGYDDTIVGNDLDNVIDGGAGNDILTGGDGADTYRFTLGAGQDVITDFDATTDRIDLSGSGLNAADITTVLANGGLKLSFKDTEIILQGIDEAEDDAPWLIF